MSAKEKTSGFMAEFKQFIARGNVMDMAVGVIVGGAFKAIADSLTQDILMPFIGIFVGEDTFADLMLEIGGAEIQYGSFLQSVLNFIIMAFVVFCLIKALNRFHRKKEEAPAAPPAPPEPSNEEKLLTEIRDLLKKEN
ncbi:large-conductance mechanosensitive channel [Oscillospiraceae bacterium]|nr:large-conductance mechanosensitive channel [Oscillospiraceae bacterium]BDF73155.1 large-conductance mechanosensitive channel [Oscillospiraceae bacterium]